MAWVTVDPDTTEYMFAEKPIRIVKGYFSKYDFWCAGARNFPIHLDIGSIKKLIGRGLSWSDEAVQI